MKMGDSMKLKDLLNETRIYQNNFIKIAMVEDTLKTLFGETPPEIEFDTDGMFIQLDTFMFRNYENGTTDDQTNEQKFYLTDAGFVDELKGIKKYYIEFTKPDEKIPEDATEKVDGDTEEPSTGFAAG
jgi:hypothetical protein